MCVLSHIRHEKIFGGNVVLQEPLDTLTPTNKRSMCLTNKVECSHRITDCCNWHIIHMSTKPEFNDYLRKTKTKPNQSFFPLFSASFPLRISFWWISVGTNSITAHILRMCDGEKSMRDTEKWKRKATTTHAHTHGARTRTHIVCHSRWPYTSQF